MLGKRYYILMIMIMIMIMITFVFVAGSARAAEEEKQLMDMAKKIAEAKQFSVSMHMGYDAVQESGQKIEFSEVRKVLVSRPNHMRVDAQLSDGKTKGLIFDGKIITLFDNDENVYSQTERPGDLDGAIRYAVAIMGVRFPLARMLVTTFPTELQKMSGDVDYVEQNTLGAVSTDHIADSTEGLDFQVWIAKDSLPRRVKVTYKNEPGQPQFWAEFTDWNMTPKISDSNFTFTPPKGAEKIQSILPAAGTKSIGKVKGGE